MSQYLNLKVKKVIKETEEAATIVFEAPKEKIEYKPGQFLTLIVPLHGENLRRSYSLSSSPYTDKDLAVTVKKMAGGIVSTFLVEQLKEGTSMEVMQPMGNFHLECDYNKKRNIILIGAGSGITPLISILKAVLSQEPLSTVHLIYGNRNEQTIIFEQQLHLLQTEHKERLKVIHVLSQPVKQVLEYSGRLNQSTIIKILESFKNLKISEAEYFLCGPHGFMEEARKALDILRISSEKIHKENFVASGETGKGEVLEDSGEIQDQEVTILYQGAEYKFLVKKGKTILEAGLAKGIDLPYSCQSGMCTACMGKCTNGKVRLNEPDGLSENEIKQGFVLTCVGYPATSGVTIEID